MTAPRSATNRPQRASVADEVAADYRESTGRIGELARAYLALVEPDDALVVRVARAIAAEVGITEPTAGELIEAVDVARAALAALTSEPQP